MYRDRIYSNRGNAALIELVRNGDGCTFLDVGCGAGGNAVLLRQRFNTATICGVTMSSSEAEVAKPFFDELYIADIQDSRIFVPTKPLDGIIFSHVLEHLIDPEEVLRRACKWLKPTGRVYIALPNVLFYQQRVRMMLGSFEYTREGLMDETHLRFYTWRSARALIERSGLVVEEQNAIGSIPLRPMRKFIPQICTGLDRVFTKCFPNLFGFHILIRARMRTQIAK